jgi:hypothetical protein
MRMMIIISSMSGGCEPLWRMTMKSLIIASVVAAAALSGGAVSAQAQDETDRTMGAGSYVNPTGPANGVWAGSASRLRYSGALVTGKKQKTR